MYLGVDAEATKEQVEKILAAEWAAPVQIFYRASW